MSSFCWSVFHVPLCGGCFIRHGCLSRRRMAPVPWTVPRFWGTHGYGSEFQCTTLTVQKSEHRLAVGQGLPSVVNVSSSKSVRFTAQWCDVRDSSSATCRSARIMRSTALRPFLCSCHEITFGCHSRKAICKAHMACVRTKCGTISYSRPSTSSFMKDPAFRVGG